VRMEEHVQALRRQSRQIRSVGTLRCEGEGSVVPKSLIPDCQEKPLARFGVPVPQTDTGRQGENPKARERTLVKELGKMTP